jgi:poly-gamma-glutamate capsule biosynthesis protein CapA/YwtB (metallophosphatase superfamily)
MKSNKEPTYRVPPERTGPLMGTRRRHRRFRFWPGLLILVLALTVVVAQSTGLLADLFASRPAPTTGTSAAPTTEPQLTEATTEPLASPTPEAPEDVRVVLAAVGDIILHQAVIDGGLVAGSDPVVYDFTADFQYVKPILAEAGLALANYEGTLAGPKYSGYPFFCAPDEIADALKSAGIDVIWTANNHTLDRGLNGVIRTARAFLDRGFTVVGTRPDESAPADAVQDVGGIKIGLMAYTFETIGTETTKALNGISMPAEADPLINSFNPYRPAAYEKDITAMLERAAVLRSQGAELICLSLHWGNEYKTRSSSYQRQLAQRLCDAGIELIIGHHPHVLQEIDVLESAATGRSTLVYYSIGNFLHNMDYDTHGSSGNAQDAVIARIHILRNADGVSVEYGEYIPTYVVRVPKGANQTQHLIVPVLPALDEPAAFQAPLKEIQASLQRITAVLEDSQGDRRIPVRQAAR